MALIILKVVQTVTTTESPIMARRTCTLERSLIMGPETTTTYIPLIQDPITEMLTKATHLATLTVQVANTAMAVTTATVVVIVAAAVTVNLLTEEALRTAEGTLTPAMVIIKTTIHISPVLPERIATITPSSMEQCPFPALTMIPILELVRTADRYQLPEAPTVAKMQTRSMDLVQLV